MSDELIERLRSQEAVDGRPHEIEQLTDEAAALIEQQAARIAELEAQIAPVAPAVDAQPVAWIDEYALRSLDSNATAVCAPIGMRDENQTIPLYTSAQSEGRLEALEEMTTRWEVRMEDANDYPSPSAKYPDLRAYHLGVAGEGEHAYNWADKPHRLVYDLTRMIAELRDAIRALSQKDPQ